MIQLVSLPPRAAETNEPEIRVGMALPAGAGSNGVGACGGDAFRPDQARRSTPKCPQLLQGAQAQRSTAGKLRHERHNAAPHSCARQATPDQL